MNIFEYIGMVLITGSLIHARATNDIIYVILVLVGAYLCLVLGENK